MEDTLLAEAIITYGAYQFTEVGVVLADDRDLSYDEWAEAFTWARKLEQCVQFWLGDLMLDGERRFGEISSQALSAADYQQGTLENYRWVAKQIPPDRRVPSLSFTHHQAVAELEPLEQESYLRLSVMETWTRDQLRHRIRQDQAAAKGLPVEPLWLVVSCSDDDDREDLADRLRNEGRSVKNKG